MAKFSAPLKELNNSQTGFENELVELISSAIRRSFEIELDEDTVTISFSEKKEYGDYSSPIAMKLAGQLKNSPIKIAEKIIESLPENDLIEAANVTAPGFINFFVSKDKLVEEFNSKLEAEPLLAGKRVMVEYAHPNPYKVLHVGHLRNQTVGESLNRTLEELGAEVIRTNYQGDVGMHIAKCIYEFRKVDPKTYPKDLDGKAKMLGDCYAKGAKAFKDDPDVKAEITKINGLIYDQTDESINKIWKLGREWSLANQKEFFDRVGSRFERQYMETEVAKPGLEICMKGLKDGVFERSKGAVIFPGEKHGVDTRVFVNSQGYPTYEGKEMGLAPMEATDFGKLDKIIHVVSKEQISFFKTTFKAQEIMWPEMMAGLQYHFSYGFVNLKDGKMSSRLGNVVLAEDVLDDAKERIREIFRSSTRELDSETEEERAEKMAVAAVKFALLRNNTQKDIYYDPETSVSVDGNSGPYVLYTYARARSVVRESGLLEEEIKNFSDLEFENDEECGVMREIFKFESVVIRSGREFLLNLIAEYLYNLSQSFNRFYGSVNILKESDKKKKISRIALANKVSEVIRRSSYLLGFEVLEEV